jgi:hypothetical protein
LGRQRQISRSASLGSAPSQIAHNATEKFAPHCKTYS